MFGITQRAPGRPRSRTAALLERTFRTRDALLAGITKLVIAASNSPRRQVVLVVLLLTAMVLRYAAIPAITSDAFDFLIPWLQYAERHGADALGVAFTNYTPFYQYLLLAAAALLDPSQYPLDGWPIVKFISFCFELMNSGLVFGILYLAVGERWRAALGAAAYLVLPTVFWNSGLWGQADAIWASFVLASLLAMLKSRYALSLLLFGIALSVKAQAVFLAPFLLGKCLQGRFPAYHFLIVPVAYLAVGLPALASGYPIGDLFLVYWGQAATFDRLNMNAANLWLFVSNDYYSVGLVLGLLLAAAAAVVLSLAMRAVRGRDNARYDFYFATLSLGWMPYLLPKMHERYFYGFEVVLLILALIDFRYLRYILVVQFAILLSYLPYSGLTAVGMPLAAIVNGLCLLLLSINPPDTAAAAATRRPSDRLCSDRIENFLTLTILMYPLWGLLLIGIRALIDTDLRSWLPLPVSEPTLVVLLAVSSAVVLLHRHDRHSALR